MRCKQPLSLQPSPSCTTSQPSGEHPALSGREYLKYSDGVKTSLPYKEGTYSFIGQNQNSMPLLSGPLKTKRNHHCSVDNKNFSLVISSAKSMDKKFRVNFFWRKLKVFRSSSISVGLLDHTGIHITYLIYLGGCKIPQVEGRGRWRKESKDTMDIFIFLRTIVALFYAPSPCKGELHIFS